MLKALMRVFSHKKNKFIKKSKLGTYRDSGS